MAYPAGTLIGAEVPPTDTKNTASSTLGSRPMPTMGSPRPTKASRRGRPRVCASAAKSFAASSLA